MDLVAAILAGGRSRRMGRDKATLVVAGRPLLEWVAAAAVEVFGAAWVIGRERPPDWPIEAVEFRVDAQADRGPLGGLGTALALGGDVLLVGCDMGGIKAGALRWLVAQAEARPWAEGVVAERDGRVEPLFGVYRQSASGEVGRRLREGNLALWQLIEARDFARVEVPAGLAEQLSGANEPGDLARLEALLRPK